MSGECFGITQIDEILLCTVRDVSIRRAYESVRVRVQVWVSARETSVLIYSSGMSARLRAVEELA